MPENTAGKIYVQEGRKPEANLDKSKWLKFPDGKYYMVAKYRSNIILKPIFNGNEVTLEAEHELPNVAYAVEEFASSIMSPEFTSSGPVISLAGAGLVMYISFLKMLRVLLLENYSWSDQKVGEVLNFSIKQYPEFLKNVILNVFYGD